MTAHLHVLTGCSPAPLANYLKALGILRLVGEQADNQSRGWWEGEQFCLLTKLSKEELETFFLERYELTPLVSPWNKGCGFFKTNDPGLVPLEKSRAARFERFRNGADASRALLDAIAHADGVIRAIKARTKTDKTFQSEQQRQLLEASDAFRVCLDELENEAKEPNLIAEQKVDVEAAISVIRLLVSKPTQRPDKTEAKGAKGNRGIQTPSGVGRPKIQSPQIDPDSRLSPSMAWPPRRMDVGGRSAQRSGRA